MEYSFVAVVVAATLAFVASAVWYAAFGGVVAKLSPHKRGGKMEAWEYAVEAVRPAIVAVALGLVFDAIGLSSWVAALVYGVVLWFAFPVVLLAGSVVHEKVPVKLAAIHAGDWLVKILLISVVVTLL